MWYEPLSQRKVEAGSHSFYNLNYKWLKPHIMIISFFLTWILCPMVFLTKKECEPSSRRQICSSILRREKEEQKSSSAGWGIMLFLASVILIFTWSPSKHLHFRLKVGQKTSSDLRLHCCPNPTTQFIFPLDKVTWVICWTSVGPGDEKEWSFQWHILFCPLSCQHVPRLPKLW